jgi:hypothetical protein
VRPCFKKKEEEEKDKKEEEERRKKTCTYYKHQYDLSLFALTLIPWLRKCLSDFSSVKLLFHSLFLYYILQKGIIVHNPHLRSRQ